MTTKCSSCGHKLDEDNVDGRFILCKHCNMFTPIGANSYIGKTNSDNYREKGGKKMTEEVKEKKVNKTLYVKCSVCGEDKFTRPDVWAKRVEKFGSEEKMKAEYVCRNCKAKAKENNTD